MRPNPKKQEKIEVSIQIIKGLHLKIVTSVDEE
jgi:hypothetical protein